MDPLAENYDSYSPYNYALNDPIGKLDPNGMWVELNKAKSWSFTDPADIAAYLQNNEINGDEQDDPKKKPEQKPVDKADLPIVLPGSIVLEEVVIKAWRATRSAVSSGASFLLRGMGGAATMTAALVLLPANYNYQLNNGVPPGELPPPPIFNFAANRDKGKNERHGDGGRAQTKSEKQIEELETSKEGKSKAGRQRIDRKIQNIKRDAARKSKGEERSRANKR